MNFIFAATFLTHKNVQKRLNGFRHATPMQSNSRWDISCNSTANYLLPNEQSNARRYLQSLTLSEKEVYLLFFIGSNNVEFIVSFKILCVL